MLTAVFDKGTSQLDRPQVTCPRADRRWWPCTVITAYARYCHLSVAPSSPVRRTAAYRLPSGYGRRGAHRSVSLRYFGSPSGQQAISKIEFSQLSQVTVTGIPLPGCQVAVQPLSAARGDFRWQLC